MAMFVDTGNPHLILLVPPKTPAPEAQLESLRRGFSGFLRGVNVTWLQRLGPQEARAQTWERGVGPTPSCASAALACLAALNRWDPVPGRLLLHVPGGDLTLLQCDADLSLSGPVQRVYEARWFL
jgi:diaminopimelate epimerase